jgi:hypothetical protein
MKMKKGEEGEHKAAARRRRMSRKYGRKGSKGSGARKKGLIFFSQEIQYVESPHYGKWVSNVMNRQFFTQRFLYRTCSVYIYREIYCIPRVQTQTHCIAGRKKNSTLCIFPSHKIIT